MLDARDLPVIKAIGFPSVRQAEWFLAQPDLWTAPVSIERAVAADVATTEHAIPVTANHGRWVVECPTCRAAQMAAPDDHRFMCIDCANAAIGGLWRPTIWPEGRDEIDALMSQRRVSLRNLEVNETASDIANQNAILRGESE